MADNKCKYSFDYSISDKVKLAMAFSSNKLKVRTILSSLSFPIFQMGKMVVFQLYYRKGLIEINKEEDKAIMR